MSTVPPPRSFQVLDPEKCIMRFVKEPFKDRNRTLYTRVSIAAMPRHSSAYL